MATILTVDKIATPPSAKTVRRESEPEGDTSARFTYPLAVVVPSPQPVPVPDTWAVPIVQTRSLVDLERALARLVPKDGLLAVDLETKGILPFKDENRIVGVGLSGAAGTAYFDTRLWEPQQWELLYEFLETPSLRFLAHNLMFDSSWLEQYSRDLRGKGASINYLADTYALYRQLANEGYPMQSGGAYSLKEAQIDLLGWQTRGDYELAEWLCTNGYYKNPNSYKNTTPEERRQLFLDGKLRAEKGEMWRAPAEILGYYCGLDAYSTYKLYTDVFLPSTQAHKWQDRFWSYHSTFIANVRALVEQFLAGIRIDSTRLQEYSEKLVTLVQDARTAFIQHPEIAPHLEQYRAGRIQKLLEREPEKYNKRKTVGQEPVRYTKKGEVSKTWERWHEKKLAIESGELDKISGSWQDWKARLDKMEQDDLFNLNSTPLRQWLFYEALAYPIVTRTLKGTPETGKKALKAWGEHGKLLKHYNDLEKERQIVASTLGVIHVHDAQSGDTRIHPQFKAPGTFTCRLAGGSSEASTGGRFNIQQIPKKREYLECWVPDPGYVMVDCDHTALEPVVLTALSQDENMLKLYGPGAKPNDIYLFVGSQLPGMGPRIREAGYDPDFPTQEGIDAAKKKCKKDRAVAKVIVLGAQYGMGPKKLKATLDLEGIPTTDDEAFQLWCGYWDIFRGIRTYKKKLEWEWKRNSGWVLNAFGRPVCCAEDYQKDLVNRVVQSSGHDFHMVFVEELERLREERGVPFQWIISDFHDQSIVQVPVDYADKMLELYREAYVRLNNKIKVLSPDFRILIQGQPMVVKDLADAKVSE